MIPFVVLAKYEVKTWDAKKIGHDLTAITKDKGLVPHYDPEHGPLETEWFNINLHAEVRNYTFNTTQAEAWHKDGDITPGAQMNCAIVTWATSKPTEIMYKDKVYQPNPLELVVFGNLACSHRRPVNCARYRWMFRQRVKLPNFLKELYEGN